MGTFGVDANGEVTSGMNHKGESTKAAPRGGASCSSEEIRESGRIEGDACSGAKSFRPTSHGRSLKDKAKPYSITRMEVLEAYFKVKSNRGAAGIDAETITDFESNLKRNLYKIWNRMSSGSYFPPPVRTVMIPKARGGERALGIPTVADRVAQMVVKNRIEWWSRCSIPTPSAIGRGNRHWMQWVGHVSDAGPSPGSVTWTSRVSSTISTMT